MKKLRHCHPICITLYVRSGSAVPQHRNNFHLSRPRVVELITSMSHVFQRFCVFFIFVTYFMFLTLLLLLFEHFLHLCVTLGY